MMPSETTPLVLAESSAHAQPHLLRDASTSIDGRHTLEVRQLASERGGRCCHDGRTRPGYLEVVRLLADLGDDDARRQLAHWLARRGHVDELRRRADAGDEHARRGLGQALR